MSITLRKAAFLGMLALFVVVSVDPDIELQGESRVEPAACALHQERGRAVTVTPALRLALLSQNLDHFAVRTFCFCCAAALEHHRVQSSSSSAI